MALRVRPDSLVHLDADEGIFFLRELEYIQVKIYEAEYPAIKHRTLIPVSEEADPATEVITYRQLDKVGHAKVISSYATDLPRIDVYGSEFSAQVKSIADAYGYSIQEIRAARKTARPLDSLKGKAAKEAALREEARIAWFGDKQHNLVGMLNNPNIPDVPFPGSAQTFSDQGVDANRMLAYLNSLANHPAELTNGVERADTLLMSLKIFNLISTTKINDASNYTVLKFFLETNPYIKMVDWVPELSGTGTVDTTSNKTGDVMIAYERNPDKIVLNIPLDFLQYPPQPKGLEFVVPCESRFGGVTVRRPFSVAIARNA